MIDNPFELFNQWYQLAEKSKSITLEAMSLATVSKDGEPSVRIVLFKGIRDRAFSFVTNYQSRKGRDLFDTHRAALTFFWPEIGRQVRIEGAVKKMSPAESDDYFASRPRGSQIGAWASEQSQAVASRQFLLDRYDEFEKKFEGQEVPRPSHWGGVLVVPSQIEFWENQEDRMHDRLLYRQDSQGEWRKVRLSP